jgi:hypothetical protein
MQIPKPAEMTGKSLLSVLIGSNHEAPGGMN